MRFRSDIEGLRAVAIVPILLFHAGVRPLRGGFIGVDIFFVISGFLITSIIVSELDRGDFSIMRFYHRRFARILPALLALIAGTMAAGLILYQIPRQLENLSYSAAAASAFASNIWFFFHADYFASGADEHPLLHTWSLAVEEQFYIFYPLIVMLLHRHGVRSLRMGLIILSIVSFAAALVIDQVSPPFAFYWLPTRFWELALGGLAALGGLPKVASRASRNVLVLAGGGLILFGLARITAGSGFPAPWAILPCVGTALLIAYGQGTISDWGLSLPPVRWIGRVSYSLYLWHWPVITFYRLIYGDKLAFADTVILVVISVGLAAISYYVIERPSQDRMRAIRERRIVIGGLAVLTAAIVATVGVAQVARSRSLPPDVQAVARYGEYAGTPEHVYQYLTGCFISSRAQTFDMARCVPLSDTKRNVVVVGDSHAAQYWRALALRFPQINVREASASGCLPLVNARGESRCTRVMREVFGPLVDSGRIDGIVLIGRWRPDTIDDLVATVRHLQGKGVKVTVFGPTVEYEGVYPYRLAHAMLDGDANGVEAFRDRARDALDKSMAAALKPTGATYHSVVEIECPNGKCQHFAAPGVPIHFDYGHVTFPASRVLVASLPTP